MAPERVSLGKNGTDATSQSAPAAVKRSKKEKRVKERETTTVAKDEAKLASDEAKARKAAKRAAKKARRAEELSEEQDIAITEDPETEKAARKAARKAEKAALKALKQKEAATEDLETAPIESKKRKRDEESEGVVEDKRSKESKKNKKAVPDSDDSRLDALISEHFSREKGAEGEERKGLDGDGIREEQSVEESGKERKKKRKEKQEGKDHKDNKDVKVREEKSELKSKKQKNKKPDPVTEEDVEELSKEERKARKKAKKAAKEAETAAISRIPPISASKQSNEVPAGGDQWNANALTGDDARKNKFLRLLGAGKKGAAVAGGDVKRGGTKGFEEIRRAESELEKQFEAGMKMKHDGGAKRRGLGA